MKIGDKVLNKKMTVCAIVDWNTSHNDDLFMNVSKHVDGYKPIMIGDFHGIKSCKVVYEANGEKIIDICFVKDIKIINQT